MKIKLETRYETQSGLPVRIYAIDGAESSRVHGAYFRDGWVCNEWDREGKAFAYHCEPSDLSLVEVKDD